MSVIRFCYDNKIDDATLVESSQVATRPVENIQDSRRTIAWRTSTLRDRAEAVLCNLGSAQTIKAVAIINHNIGTENPGQRIIRLLGSSRGKVFYALSEYTRACWLWYGDCNDWSAIAQHLTSRGTGNDYTLRSDKGACAILNGSGWFRRTDADCGTNFDFGTGDFTLKAWIKTSSINKTIYSKRQAAPICGIHWYISATGKVGLALGDGTNSIDIFSNTISNDNAWHFIAVTVNRTTGKANFYLDGNWDGVDRDISSITGSVNCDEPLIIGALNDTGTNAWIGSIGAMIVEKGIARTEANLDADYAGIQVVETLTYNSEIIIKNFTGGSYQYWLLEMRDVDNIDNYLEAGRVFLGTYFEPTKTFQNIRYREVDPSNINYSEGSQKNVESKTSYQVISLDMQCLSQYTYFKAFIDHVGKYKDFFVELDYGTYPNTRSFYVHFEDTPELSSIIPGKEYYRVAMSMRENR